VGAKPAVQHDIASVQVGPYVVACRAREGEGAELERHWPQLVALWPAYSKHYRRSGKRAVFVIYFNDGRIGGEIVEVGPDVLRVRIERAAVTGSRLRAAKGINVPDTRLPIPASTDTPAADSPSAPSPTANSPSLNALGHRDRLRKECLSPKPPGEYPCWSCRNTSRLAVGLAPCA
jgi:hypothetical protein